VSEFTVSVFTVDYTVWQECGWTGGQVRQPGGKPPSPQCARPWALGQTRAPGACANLEASPLALGLPGLGRWADQECTLRFGCHAHKQAAQAPRGT